MDGKSAAEVVRALSTKNVPVEGMISNLSASQENNEFVRSED